jgi:NAD(P)-dependent dehydrogenase (short-subunit alcohol dehydrogenase family)
MILHGRRVAVTGGAGLIGSFLVDRLLAAGALVTVADDFSKGRRAHLAHCVDRIEIREGNLEERDAMDAALDGAEIVFHLASRAYGVGFSAGNHLAILERTCWSRALPASIATTVRTRSTSGRCSTGSQSRSTGDMAGRSG